jgi:hypothetical protein
VLLKSPKEDDMYNAKSGTRVTFNAPALPVANDPDTYEEHLEFASWYHAVTSTRRVNANVRAAAKEHLTKYSLMELRALFLFALFEYAEELKKGNVLDPLERMQLWDRLDLQGLIFFDNESVPHATDAAQNFKFEN